MKPKKTLVCCEHCDTAHEFVLPHTSKQYEMGFIYLGEFSTLMEGNTSIDLQGYYCNFDCLRAFITEAQLKKEKDER